MNRFQTPTPGVWQPDLSVRKQLAYITLVTCAAQFAAFVKLWLVARYFGVGAELDGYNLAFVMPALISGVISGALQTGLFPVHAQMRVQQGIETTAHFERALFWCLLGVGGAISIVFLAASTELGGFVARSSSMETREAAVYVLRFAAFAVMLNVIGDYLSFVLALRERFIIAAAAPIANALVGASLLAAWPQGGLTNLALGTLLGILAQVGISLWGARLANFSPLGALPSLASVQREVMEVARLSSWILPGVGFANLTNALPQLLVAPFGEGAVSAFGYAFRLHQSALQLLIMAASPVILASFSELVASKNWQTLVRLQRKALWLSVVGGFGALITVGTMGETLLWVAFGHGRFDADAAQRVSAHWFWLSCGFGIALYGNVLAKRIQAEKGAKILSALGMTGTLTFIAAALILRAWLGEMSVPIALAFAVATPTFLMAVLLRSRVFVPSERQTESEPQPVIQCRISE